MSEGVVCVLIVGSAFAGFALFLGLCAVAAAIWSGRVSEMERRHEE